jgi:rare lipoprotein A
VLEFRDLRVEFFDCRVKIHGSQNNTRLRRILAPKLKLLMAALLLATSLSAETVRASFYADRFEGHRMANGRPYHALTVSAASRTYPLGSTLRVQSVRTGKVIYVQVTDRGPWVYKFSLDLSKQAFRDLGLKTKDGWGWVKVSKER